MKTIYQKLQEIAVNGLALETEEFINFLEKANGDLEVLEEMLREEYYNREASGYQQKFDDIFFMDSMKIFKEL